MKCDRCETSVRRYRRVTFRMISKRPNIVKFYLLSISNLIMIYVAQPTVERCLYIYVFQKCRYGRLRSSHVAVAKSPMPSAYDRTAAYCFCFFQVDCSIGRLVPFFFFCPSVIHSGRRTNEKMNT